MHALLGCGLDVEKATPDAILQALDVIERYMFFDQFLVEMWGARIRRAERRNVDLSGINVIEMFI
jgi:hypothetical protein